MKTLILSYQNIHEHGSAFVEFLRARHSVFIQEKRWPLPEEDGMEFDQYDTPQSRWVAVLDDRDEVVAGFRMTRTTARCGAYSYMIRDAYLGILDTIPSEILSEDAPRCESVWECTRAFVSPNVPPECRAQVRRFMIEAFLPSVQSVGGTDLVALTSPLWKRWMPMHGISGRALGPVVRIDGEPYQVVRMTSAVPT